MERRGVEAPGARTGTRASSCTTLCCRLAHRVSPPVALVTRRRFARLGAGASGLYPAQQCFFRRGPVLYSRGRLPAERSESRAQRGVPVVLEQKPTILWKRLYLMTLCKALLAWVGRTRQNAEVRKKTL